MSHSSPGKGTDHRPENLGEERLRQPEQPQSAEDLAAMMAKNPADRERIIREEEKDFNNEERKKVTLMNEKDEIRNLLVDYSEPIAEKIAEFKQNSKNTGEDVLKQKEALIAFLKGIGFHEKALKNLEAVFPEHTEGPQPKHHHLMIALVNAINSRSSDSADRFIKNVLRAFEESRGATYYEDDLAFALYLDRSNDKNKVGFYRRDDGNGDFVYQKALAQIQKSQSTQNNPA